MLRHVRLTRQDGTELEGLVARELDDEIVIMLETEEEVSVPLEDVRDLEALADDPVDPSEFLIPAESVIADTHDDEIVGGDAILPGSDQA